MLIPGDVVGRQRFTIPNHLESLGLDGDPDVPHDWCGMEWWYVNLHVETSDGRQLSAFAAFFRVGTEKPGGGVDHSHTLAAAWCDPQAARYQQLAQLDAANLQMIRDLLHHDRVYDPRVRRALEEVVSQGLPPLPDLPLGGPAELSAEPFNLSYGSDATFGRDERGGYRLRLRHPSENFALDVVLDPLRPAAWQGLKGTVDGLGAEGEEMRYYSVTRLAVTGELLVDGVRCEIVRGTAWYDHQWGLAPMRTADGFPARQATWDWCGLQLDNGWDVSVSVASKVDAATGESTECDRISLIVMPDGTVCTADGFALLPGPVWTSLQTCNQYPLSWTLIAPSRDIELTLRASFARQEVRTITTHRGFWEGRVEVSGRVGGASVSGLGFVEVMPAQLLTDIDQLTSPIAAETRRIIGELYPAKASPQATLGLLGPNTHDLLDAVSHDELYETLADPILHLVDGSGKGWRSFALAAALEVLGVDSDPYRALMAVVELIHAGSLIVDDVQDHAVRRRGRPAVHTVFGTATAINAGTAAYFSFDRILRGIELRPHDRLHAYKVFCGMLRNAHAGQGLDIRGLAAAMDRALAGDQSVRIGERVLAVHRLKTALPVRGLADLAAVLAGATPTQHSAICDYFEALGLCYQISDDVLDLRGHKAGGQLLKMPGEDLRNGKVTYPLACAVELLPLAESADLWQRIRSCPQASQEVAQLIGVLEDSGAVTLALQRSRSLVDRAWGVLEPHLPNYLTKAMLRALGHFAAQRDAELKG